VVHSAALSDVDRCEREPELARRVNVDGSERIARACAARGVALVALSTDLVFPGESAFSPESAVPQPLSVYGRTKLAGEAAVLALCPSAAITRVALVIGCGYGPRATGSEAIAWALREGRTARLFTDQYRTPIDADSVAEAIALVLQRRASGRFHLGGLERVSRYELGLRVARLLALSSGHVEAVAYRAEPTEGPRPADASLDSQRTRQELGWMPRGLDAAILLGRAAPDIIPAR
jgi:dTDP-4-dehydrorhamnose reductase